MSEINIQMAVDYNNKLGKDAEFWKRVQRIIGTDDDGQPGPNTAQAIADWQEAKRLVVDGQLGSTSQSAMQIMTRLLVCETGREPFFFHTERVAVDCDGAPTAYKEGDPPEAIDWLVNAGHPDHGSYGLALDSNGKPYVQRATDPAPGFYVSVTALADPAFAIRDPHRYIDSLTVPYLVLPRNVKEHGPAGHIRKGDVGLVARADGSWVFGQYADVSGKDSFGEASIAMLEALGHDPWSGNKANQSMYGDTLFVVFPRTGEGRPLEREAVLALAWPAFMAWGGEEALARAWNLALQRSW